jgi:hypothetical protein
MSSMPISMVPGALCAFRCRSTREAGSPSSGGADLAAKEREVKSKSTSASHMGKTITVRCGELLHLSAWTGPIGSFIMRRGASMISAPTELHRF